MRNRVRLIGLAAGMWYGNNGLLVPSFGWSEGSNSCCAKWPKHGPERSSGDRTRTRMEAVRARWEA
jgi:hypothetical protein